MSYDPFIGEIKIFGFNFTPIGYESCNGQLMAISQNAALFALIGTIYGGDGQVTFALPDLQGRVPIGQGQGPGLGLFQIGQEGGTVSKSILINNMPAHVHNGTGMTINVPVSEYGADTSIPTDAYLANAKPSFYAATGATAFSAPLALSGNTSIAGANIPIGVENPYLILNHSIALEGVFPSQ